MTIANTSQSYGSLSKLFHWATALLIFAIIPLGLIAHEMPYDTSEQLSRKALLFSLHKTLGVAVFFVAVLRILWALTQPKPGPLHPENKAETFAADLVHWLLYGALVLAPLSGWIHHAATTGFAPIWWPFGQSLPFVPKDDSIAHVFGSMHWIWTKVMGLAILLHVAGALKHVVIDKDKTLARMWFGKTDLPHVTSHITPAAAPWLAAGLFAITGFGMALANPKGEHSGPEAIALAEVDSNWTVQSGTLAIATTQFGGTVDGSFAEWIADIDFDPTAKTGSVDVTIAIGSLTLGSVTSEAMGPDYFDATGFPSATFAGPITHIDGDQYQTAGTLTLKGQTVDVTLDYTLSEADGVWTMSGGAELDRRDFGIGDNQGESNLGFGVTVTTELSAIQG